MDGPPDPDTPSRPPLAVDGGGHTRPSPPNSPSNIQNRGKRSRTVQTQVPAIKFTGLNPSARQHGVANAIMASSLDEMVRAATMRKTVTMKLAAALDEYVATYTGDHNKEQRAIAKELVSSIAIHLRKQHFAAPGGEAALPIGQSLSSQTSGAPQNPPKSNGARTQSSAPTSYASAVASNLPGPTEKRQAAPRPAKLTPTVSTKEDLRVLATLHQTPATSTAPRQDSFHIRAAICKALKLQLADIPKVTHTQTGFAIHPASKVIRDKVVSEESKTLIQRACACVKLALPEKWHTYALTDVPYTFMNLSPDMPMVDTDTILAEEAQAQTGLTPIDFKRSQFGPNPSTGRGTFIVSFLEPVRRFQLFGTGGFSRPVQKAPKVHRHAKGCQGYCNPRACTRAPRCHHCSDRLDSHSPGELALCARAARCANCYGPYEAGHEKCPAAPRVVKKRVTPLTRSELAAVRKVGLQAYQRAGTQAADANPDAGTQAADANPDAMEEDTDVDLLRQQLETEAPSTLQGAATKRSLSGAAITRARPHNTPSPSSVLGNTPNPGSGASLEVQGEEAPSSSARPLRTVNSTPKNYKVDTRTGFNKAAGIDNTPSPS